MTVAQLIDILREHDEGDIVLVDGYEGGLSDVLESNVYQTRFDKNVREFHYVMGEHEADEEGQFFGLVIGRKPGWRPPGSSAKEVESVTESEKRLDEYAEVFRKYVDKAAAKAGFPHPIIGDYAVVLFKRIVFTDLAACRAAEKESEEES